MEQLHSLRHTEMKEPGQRNCILSAGPRWAGLCRNNTTYIPTYTCTRICFSRRMLLRIIELLRLEKTLKVVKSNHNLTMLP